MKLSEKLKTKYQALKKVNDELSKYINDNGGGATGITATMFINSSKDLIKVKKQIMSALRTNAITTDEYRDIYK